MISVIVPVYKVEPYLDRCVQSIVDQTYLNLEIILVDDGSPDNCPAMCDAWAVKDSRIKVIHKSNGGLSDARNAGMAAATGEYIAFVDSDDWISPDMYHDLLDRLVSTDSDIASCDALRVWDDGTPCCKMIRERGSFVLDRVSAMKALIQSTCLIQTVWNKLYKSTLAKSVQFEKGKIHEDEFWSWQVISNASRVATIDKAFYFYYQRSGSIMGNGFTGSPMLIVEAKRQRHEFITSQMPELSDIDSENLLNTCLYQGVQILRHEPWGARQNYFSSIKKTVSLCSFSKEYVRRLGFFERIRVYIISHHVKSACLAAVVYGVE